MATTFIVAEIIHSESALIDNNIIEGNNMTSLLFSTPSYVVLAINYPFLIVFVMLFVTSIASYVIQRKHMKRNQHVLFSLLFILESLICVNMLTRTSAEFGFLHSDIYLGKIINAVIKIFDRCIVNSAVYMEIVIMCHISLVFCETCRLINAFSVDVVKKIRQCVIAFLLVFALLYVILSAIAVVFGAVVSSGSQAQEAVIPVNMVLFLTASLLFFASSLMVSILLNIIGRKLRHHLKESKKRIMNAALHDLSFKQNLDTQHTPSVEWIKTYNIKKSALLKSMIIQYGLSASLLLQCIGFIFIPSSLGWSYLLNMFHAIYNFGLTLFIVFILIIYHPMKQVTKLFRESSETSKLPSTPLATVCIKNSSSSDHDHPPQGEESSKIVKGHNHTCDCTMVESILEELEVCSSVPSSGDEGNHV
ncbi:hypothetical protein C9374_004508 [Naegleria lovaniensis]|uniref:Uncharacterized protein n=1 Tax=Naegleria lovaniensis TaxID=51637 RepID=A0AA88GQ11_NAELO|nr:uncharacterized protein C9374_004508 [Naegleria lovaniensis]KAG2383171.1 hypothetical protein C9374_004508 [Naegleria lovaniensis]